MTKQKIKTIREATVQNVVNNIYKCKNKKQLSQFYHASLFSPIKSTLLKAIKAGYFRGCPGLTSKVIKALSAVVDAT